MDFLVQRAVKMSFSAVARNGGHKRPYNLIHSNEDVLFKSARIAPVLWGVHVVDLSPQGLLVELNGTAFQESRREALLDIFSKSQSIVFRHCLGTPELLSLLAQSHSPIQNVTIITRNESIHEKLQIVGGQCPHLKKLSWLRLMGDKRAMISPVLRVMPGLTTIILSAPHFENVTTFSTHANIRKITLHLDGVLDLDRYLPQFLKAFPQLQSLKLYEPSSLTDKGLSAMALSCSTLRKCHLISHAKAQPFSVDGVNAFLSYCSGL